MGVDLREMKKKINYRHIICIGITLGFIACSVFVFPNALGRIIEGGRDLGLSVAFYFCEMFGIEYGFTPTVTELPKFPFFPLYSGDSPTTTLPETLTGFKSNFVLYWQLWINEDNFFGYLSVVGNVLYKVALIVTVLIPFILIAIVVFKRYLKRQNNDYNTDSKPLKAFRKIVHCTYRPVKLWLSDLIYFIRENRFYKRAWLLIWLYNFNALTMLVEFIAYYFYFAMSFDVVNLYIQFYKLALDLWAVIDFIPLWVWFILGYFVLNAISIKIAYLRLYHNEWRNCGFINERGVVTICYGAMGVGKTMQITDMALSTEVQFRNTAFEIILETDMKFPYFPWIEFELRLKWAMQNKTLHDLPSCRKWVRQMRDMWCNDPYDKSLLFNYDYERYGLTYDDKLKITDIWSALEDYACAYFIYTVQTSLLISNYSVRVDSLKADIGNFPLWDTDFFKRDSRLIDSYSRHAHILDFDMLRLGRQMLKDNPNRNAFGFGVYIISEIDKERKNTPELKEIKASSAECNQKNDLFNVLLKMSRHACVVANRVFVKVYADLQRPSSLGADALDLGEIIDIKDKGDMSLLLPFFAPFRIFDFLFGWLKNRFVNFYTKYRFNRADNTLLLYLIKGITAKLSKYCEGVHNTFSSQTLHLEVERGSREGEVKKAKYYRMPKKIYSKRFSTDCLSGIFETRAQANCVGIDDLKEYADIMATADELGLQNAHFQTEINALSGAE